METNLPEIFSPFITAIVDAILKSLNLFFHVRLFQSQPDFIIGITIKWIKVHSNGTWKQHWILKSGGKMLSKEVGIFQRENDFFKQIGENSQLNKLKKKWMHESNLICLDFIKFLKLDFKTVKIAEGFYSNCNIKRKSILLIHFFFYSTKLNFAYSFLFISSSFNVAEMNFLI